MTVTRREFGAVALLGVGATAGAVRRSAQSESISRESVRAMLDGQSGASLFDDDAWLDLLHRAVELNAETRARLRDYELSADAEPAITFVRY